VAAAALLLYCACSQIAAQNPPPREGVRWSPLLKLSNREEIADRLARPFGDVFEGHAHGRKATISNCNDYLRLSGQGFQTSNMRAGAILEVDAVECVALVILRSARAPQADSLRGFQMNATALSLLPPELAPAVSNELVAQAKAADAAGQSWQTYVPKATARVLGPWQLAVSQPGWNTQVTLYALGDLSGSGQEELLMRADYRVQQGTYANSRLFLLTRGAHVNSRLRLIREVPVP
jgi:hypothetical protein